MKIIALSIFLLANVSAFAQTDTLTYADLQKELRPIKSSIRFLQIENNRLKAEIVNLNNRLEITYAEIDSLKKKNSENADAINQTANGLGIQISTNEQEAHKRIDDVNQSLGKTSLYGIIGVLSAILLSGLLYWLLSKRQKTDKTDFIDQLNKTKSSIEESLVKEFGKQTELMDLQLHLIEQQKTTLQATPSAEPDHSLALKVADEITLIERNISLMDAATKGLKQLSRSVSKLKDNLAANGYEMPELLGKPLNRGMHSIPVNTIPDESLEPGVEMITKIIKPQVNYNDKMIQAAQIEVSVGY